MNITEYVESLGIVAPKAVYRNLSPAKLTEHALERGEGKLSETGALVVYTGKYTGRSPDDRFIVDEGEAHTEINWNKNNVAISREKADAIFNKLTAYMQHRDVFVFSLASSVTTRTGRAYLVSAPAKPSNTNTSRCCM